MSRKKYHSNNKYGSKSAIKSPTLEIDLKQFDSTSTSKRSPYHSSIDLNVFIDSTPSILRPITVETLTPPISRNWKNTKISALSDDSPITKAKHSYYKVKNRENDLQKKKYYEMMKKLNKILEEEEEAENIHFSDFSDEMDEKPLNHLNSLISKIKTKSFEIRCDPEKSISFLKAKEIPISISEESTEEYDFSHNTSINSLEMQCYRLNKYLEDNEINVESEESNSSINRTCDMKNNNTFSKVRNSNKALSIQKNTKQSFSPDSNRVLSNHKNTKNSVTPKKYSNNNSFFADESIQFSSQCLSSPIQRKQVVSSSQGALHKGFIRTDQTKKKNASISCHLFDDV